MIKFIKNKVQDFFKPTPKKDRPLRDISLGVLLIAVVSQLMGWNIPIGDITPEQTEVVSNIVAVISGLMALYKQFKTDKPTDNAG